MKIAILATASPTGEKGGAERFDPGLVNALIAAGANAEIVPVVSDEETFHRVRESYLRFYDLDLTGYDAVISTKAPGYMARHPNHLCYLQHTIRRYYDLFNTLFPDSSKKELQQREFIHNLDTLALQPPRTRRIFTIGHEVSRRLKAFNSLDSEVLYQANTLKGLRQGNYQHIFLPGRVNRFKRGDLVIEAMRYVRSPVKLLIAGTGGEERHWKWLARKDPRIRFLGRVSDKELPALYADALCVAFVPLREDFGLVTLEAFHSHKPVITCSDSGEPARLVEHGKSGFVCSPDPEHIAAHIELLAADPASAKRMGQRGAESIRDIRWGHVATTLLDALEREAKRARDHPTGR